MAIAFDATSGNGGVGSNLSAVVWSHTTTGSDITLVVQVNSNLTASGITSVSFNGVTVTTPVAAAASLAGTGACWVFVLPNVGAATGNITVNTTGSQGVWAVAASYTGTSHTQPDATNSKTQTGGTTLAIATTSIADNCWAVMGLQCNSGTPSAGSGTDVRVTSANAQCIADSNGVIHPAGSYTLNISQGGSKNYVAYSVTLAPMVVITTIPNVVYQKNQAVNRSYLY